MDQQQGSCYHRRQIWPSTGPHFELIENYPNSHDKWKIFDDEDYDRVLPIVMNYKILLHNILSTIVQIALNTGNLEKVDPRLCEMG